jgi:hypothetical protein
LFIWQIIDTVKMSNTYKGTHLFTTTDLVMAVH